MWGVGFGDVRCGACGGWGMRGVGVWERCHAWLVPCCVPGLVQI